MEQNTTQLQHTLKYGLYTGGIIILFLLILYITGRANIQGLQNIPNFIFIGGVYLSVRHYRDKIMAGVLDFGKSYGTAVLTCLFAGAVWSVYTYLLYQYLLPELFLERLQMFQEVWLNMGMSEEMVEMQSTLFTPFILAIGTIFSAVFWGAIISLALAALLKRNVNPLIDNKD